MKVSEKEIAAIRKLPGEKRYIYSVKRIVDAEEAWGLYNEGWALGALDDEKQIFPIWSAMEFAEECADGEWAEYLPSSIPLNDLLDQLLPGLDSQGISLAVAYLPGDRGVVVTPNRLSVDLENESSKYE